MPSPGRVSLCGYTFGFRLEAAWLYSDRRFAREPARLTAPCLPLTLAVIIMAYFFMRTSSCASPIPARRLPQARSLSVFLALMLWAAGITHAQAASDRYLDDIKHLTVPAMEGRGDGTNGLTRAAHLIVERYKSLGLEPAGTQSFLQPFSVVTGSTLKSRQFSSRPGWPNPDRPEAESGFCSL